MSQFDYKIEFIPGTSNVIADAISRLCNHPPNEPIKDDDEIHGDDDHFCPISLVCHTIK